MRILSILILSFMLTACGKPKQAPSNNTVTAQSPVEIIKEVEVIKEVSVYPSVDLDAMFDVLLDLCKHKFPKQNQLGARQECADNTLEQMLILSGREDLTQPIEDELPE